MSDSRFEIVLLDADETIFDFIASEKNALLRTASEFGLSPDENDTKVYSTINLSLWKQLELGTVSREELTILRFEQWLEYLCEFNINPIEFNMVYEDNLSKAGILFPGAENFVNKLSDSTSVYIVTNGTAKCQHGRMNTSPVKNHISGMFISEEIGFAKPDKRFFDVVIDSIGITSLSEVIIVGDSLTSDMQGGRNAGITTCLYCPSANVQNNPLCDYIITDYNQLFEII